METNVPYESRSSKTFETLKYVSIASSLFAAFSSFSVSSPIIFTILSKSGLSYLNSSNVKFVSLVIKIPPKNIIT